MLNFAFILASIGLLSAQGTYTTLGDIRCAAGVPLQRADEAGVQPDARAGCARAVGCAARFSACRPRELCPLLPGRSPLYTSQLVLSSICMAALLVMAVFTVASKLRTQREGRTW